MPRKSLKNLYYLLETKVRAFEILGVTKDKCAAILFPLVESVLPKKRFLHGKGIDLQIVDHMMKKIKTRLKLLKRLILIQFLIFFKMKYRQRKE